MGFRFRVPSLCIIVPPEDQHHQIFPFFRHLILILFFLSISLSLIHPLSVRRLYGVNKLADVSRLWGCYLITQWGCWQWKVFTYNRNRNRIHASKVLFYFHLNHKAKLNVLVCNNATGGPRGKLCPDLILFKIVIHLCCTEVVKGVEEGGKQKPPHCEIPQPSSSPEKKRKLPGLR